MVLIPYNGEVVTVVSLPKDPGDLTYVFIIACELPILVPRDVPTLSAIGFILGVN